METQRFTIEDIKKAADFLKKGALVSFPTETVYGLGASALSESAVKQVYQVKGRPSDNPLIVHVNGKKMMEQYVENLPGMAETLIDHFWPGPLTLILPMKEGSFSSVVTGGLTTVAFRMPDHPLTLQLIEEAGIPLVGPSANTSGKPSPTTADHVFHDLRGKIEGVVDGGPTQIGVESTVLDLSDSINGPMILRPGAVTKEELEQVIGTVRVDRHLLVEKEAPKAPGMKYKHYSPDTPVWIVENTETDWLKAVEWANAQNKKAGIFTDRKTAERLGNQVTKIFSFGENTVEQATKQLFSGLRKLDDAQVDIIFAPSFPENGLGEAYMNRLKKAAGQNFLKI
ncbi:threonylcarbamoyl-AMP synthase [Enterococcus sp. BWB1-3]|uniref:L-threonylcarbamoyladenylate synthase n=1 Tax=unclassified Enterococcus TaxID=2608891 RepID=UPI00192463FE|nr:L-threonylcarbamoyladenylate synthase [Enterococcus sp. CWB-B31]MBL1228012.1 threonylcarbamoyl-AMP synthase [Enterococcus sp. BWB1-3]MCB5954049.1 threonylcarbamoyl-AMP synthase [Enterococcus sp. CWB-B31]